MKEWLWNNAAGIVFGLLGSAGIIGAFCSDLYAVICAGPWPFWIWSAGVAVLFAAIAWYVRSVVVKRALGMPLKDAAEALDEDRRREREAKEAAERAKAEREKKARKAEEEYIELVKSLDFESKEDLLEFYENPYVDIPVGQSWEFESECGFATWVTFETVSREIERWALKPWARKFLDRHPELLSCVRDAQAASGKVKTETADMGATDVESDLSEAFEDV